MGKDFVESLSNEFGVDLRATENASPVPFYNAHGDCIEFLAADKMYYADWVDARLTLYRAQDGDGVIGFQIKGVAALAERIGADAAHLEAEMSGGEITKISMDMIMLAWKDAPTETELTAFEPYRQAARQLLQPA